MAQRPLPIIEAHPALAAAVKRAARQLAKSPTAAFLLAAAGQSGWRIRARRDPNLPADEGQASLLPREKTLLLSLGKTADPALTLAETLSGLGDPAIALPRRQSLTPAALTRLERLSSAHETGLLFQMLAELRHVGHPGPWRQARKALPQHAAAFSDAVGQSRRALVDGKGMAAVMRAELADRKVAEYVEHECCDWLAARPEAELTDPALWRRPLARDLARSFFTLRGRRLAGAADFDSADPDFAAIGRIAARRIGALAQRRQAVRPGLPDWRLTVLDQLDENDAPVISRKPASWLAEPALELQGGPADRRRLAAAIALLRQSPTGQGLLDLARATHYVVRFGPAWLDKSGAEGVHASAASTVLLNPAHSVARLAAVLAHEFTHTAQSVFGAKDTGPGRPLTDILTMRMDEADANAVALQVCHELREQGLPEAWLQYTQDAQSLGKAYDAALAEHGPRAARDGRAMAAAFQAFYKDGMLRYSYEDFCLKGLEAHLPLLAHPQLMTARFRPAHLGRTQISFRGSTYLKHLKDFDFMAPLNRAVFAPTAERLAQLALIGDPTGAKQARHWRVPVLELLPENHPRRARGKTHRVRHHKVRDIFNRAARAARANGKPAAPARAATPAAP